MGDKITVAMRFDVLFLQPVAVTVSISMQVRVLPSEWRISNKRTKPAVLPRKHFGKLYLPMKRRNRMLAASQALSGCGDTTSYFRVELAVFDVLIVLSDVSKQFFTAVFAFFFFRARKERTDASITSQTDDVQRLISLGQP